MVIYVFTVNKGGEDFVILNILEALNDAGYNVSLLTSHPKGLYESAKLFSKLTPDVDIRHAEVLSRLRHPYTIAYITRKTVKTEGNTYDPYLVSDDIPKYVASQRGAYYMHYPHGARFKFKEYVATRYGATYDLILANGKGLRFIHICRCKSWNETNLNSIQSLLNTGSQELA